MVDEAGVWAGGGGGELVQGSGDPGYREVIMFFPFISEDVE